MAVADLDRHEMWRPPSLAALVDRLAERHAAGQKTVLLAGGADWVVEQEMARPRDPSESLPLLADISCLAELRGVALSGDTLRIGAATSCSAIYHNKDVAKAFPADVRDRISRALGHVWFSSLMGWVNGWVGIAEAGDELASATHLMLDHFE